MTKWNSTLYWWEKLVGILKINHNIKFCLYYDLLLKERIIIKLYY